MEQMAEANEIVVESSELENNKRNIENVEEGDLSERKKIKSDDESGNDTLVGRDVENGERNSEAKQLAEIGDGNVEDGEVEGESERKKIIIDDESGKDTLVVSDVENGEINSEAKQAEIGDEGEVLLVEGKVKEETKCELPQIPRKKKCVLLLSYCGSDYNGMQRNPGVRTIEEDLTNALFKANAISEDALRNFGKMSFQRCARTDKGVSAARQVVSLKMVPSKELLPEINKHLEPAPIKVFALKKVTRGFDCKSRCTSRTYEYLIPTFAFSSSYAHTTPSYRISRETIDQINKTLLMYKGTKNFHNFTSGKNFKEESSKRYIINFEIAGEPFVEKEVEFLVLQVQGQSFMQHQIRKMIGLLLGIMRKCTGEDAIERSFQEPKMDIPKAPGLGLILDQVHFESYNKKFGSDNIHERLEWSECEEKILEFKKQFIHNKIIETEVTTNSMMRWLRSIPTHTYSSVGMSERASDTDLVKEQDKEEEEEDIKVLLDSAAEMLPQEESVDVLLTK